MIRTVYEQVALIDTSAVLALHDPSEQFHRYARSLFSSQHGLVWAVLDATSHECFTRARYRSTFRAAMDHYSFLRDSEFKLLRFSAEDEIGARDLLERYSKHSLSFHDALCAAVMKRIGIYRVFTFDRDFAVLGFEILPGPLAP
ncbi:MAG: type II toxin-antitoxin system VapC family toxin [bacterium]